ncbi:hypothetical protein TYRP_007093, partial [Tyrophagus putrescentiae]
MAPFDAERLVECSCASETSIARLLPEISAFEVPVSVSCIASTTGTTDSCLQTVCLGRRYLRRHSRLICRTDTDESGHAAAAAVADSARGRSLFWWRRSSQVSPTSLSGLSHSRAFRMAPAPAFRAEDHHHHHHMSTSVYAGALHPSFFLSLFPSWAATHGQTSAWRVSIGLSSLHICWVIKRPGPSRYYCPSSDVGGPKRTVDKDGRLSEDGEAD